MIVHEDDIVAAKPMGLLEATQRREAADMGLDLNDPEQAEAYRQAQEMACLSRNASVTSTRYVLPSLD